jgi:antimicrobial peptide system SdpA family protein
MQAGSLKSTVKLRVCWLVANLAVAVFAAFLVIVSLPYNPVSLREERVEREVRSFMPEGWAFFTRSPREQRIDILLKTEHGWERNPLAPMGRPSNWFGLHRQPRAQSVEMAMLFDQIDPGAWLPRQDELENALDTVSPLPVENTSPNPVLTGTICLHRYEPVPWAWARLTTPDKMPGEFVVLEIHRAAKP